MKQKQKFHEHDIVQITRSDYPFEEWKGVIGVIVGSFNDRYGGSGGYDSYTVRLPKLGEVSWFHNSQLTLVRKRKKCKECGSYYGEKR